MKEPSRDAARGLGLVLLSTLAFGVLPILGKAAYAAGVRVLPFLTWRYLVAALLFTLLLGRRPLPWRTRLRLWAIGFVFVFNSVAYFLALARTSASTVSLLLFCYPVIVALLAAAVGLERLTLRSEAMSHTHISAMKRACRILIRVVSPSTLKKSARS